MSSNRLDILGAGLSFMCLAHCIILPLLPLLIAGLPWLADERTHLTLLVLVTPIALFAFYKGYRVHRKLAVIAMGLAGLLVLILGPFSGETLEKPLTVAGSLVLCAAHLINRRVSR